MSLAVCHFLKETKGHVNTPEKIYIINGTLLEERNGREHDDDDLGSQTLKVYNSTVHKITYIEFGTIQVLFF